MLQIVGKNKHVLLSYSITDADTGVLLEQIELPIPYIHGGQQAMLERVEQALVGAKAGDWVEVRLSPAEAYGEPDPALIFTERRANVPAQFHRPGAEVEFQSDRGDVKSFLVTSVNENEITIDGNNPLVGKNIIFSVQIHAIRDASATEIREGRPDQGPKLS